MAPRIHKSLLLLVTIAALLLPANSSRVAAQAEADFEAVVHGTIITTQSLSFLAHMRHEGTLDGITFAVIARRGGASTGAVHCLVEIDPSNPVHYRTRQNDAHGRGYILAHPVAAAGVETTTGNPCVVDIVDGVEDEHHPWANNHSPGQFHREGTVARFDLKIRVVTGDFDHHYCVRGVVTAVPDRPFMDQVYGEARGDVVDRGPEGRCPEHELRRDLPEGFSDRFHG